MTPSAFLKYCLVMLRNLSQIDKIMAVQTTHIHMRHVLFVLITNAQGCLYGLTQTQWVEAGELEVGINRKWEIPLQKPRPFTTSHTLLSISNLLTFGVSRGRRGEISPRKTKLLVLWSLELKSSRYFTNALEPNKADFISLQSPRIFTITWHQLAHIHAFSAGLTMS